MPSQKRSREELDKLALARHLLKLEPLGVLSREICYQAIPLEDEEGKRLIIPPRLFFIPKYFTLVHCYGDPSFYTLNPEFKEGGLSKECYVLDRFPRFLSNYFAMEDTYQKAGVAPKRPDLISLEARKPPPLTRAEQKEILRELSAQRKVRSHVLKAVEIGGQQHG